MTQSEFRHNRARYSNRVILGVMAFSAVLLPGALLIHHLCAPDPTWPVLLRIGVIAVVSLVLIAGVAVLMTFEERWRRLFGMSCPRCQAKVGGRHAVNHEAGTCRGCGGRLWDH